MFVRLSAYVLAMATAVVPSALEAQRGSLNSRSSGPSFGVSLAAVSLSTRADDDFRSRDFSGAGVQMEVGWHMLASRFGLLLDYANITIDENGPPNIRSYNHIAGLGRYMFRSDRDITRPYLELGLNRREVIGRTPGPVRRTVRSQSIGGTVGGGFQVFLARPVSLDFGAQLGLGAFGDWERGDDVISGGMPELEQGTVVIRFGVRFWPGM